MRSPPRPLRGSRAGGEGKKVHANLFCTGKLTESSLNSPSQVGYKLEERAKFLKV